MTKRIRLIGLILVLAANARAQNADDEHAIRLLIASHAAAWNNRDAKAAAAVYCDDATIVLGSGRVFAGRVAIEKWHSDTLSVANPNTHTHPPETTTIHFLGPEIAVADVESRIPGAVGA